MRWKAKVLRQSLVKVPVSGEGQELGHWGRGIDMAAKERRRAAIGWGVARGGIAAVEA